MTGSLPGRGRSSIASAAHRPAPAPRSAEPSDGGPQFFSLPHRTKDSRDRPAASVPRHLARRFGSRPRKNRQSFNLFFGHRQFDCSPPPGHDPAPRLANHKTRNPPSNHLFHNAGFMESIV